MQRVPEPELMTEEAQALAYAEADFSEPHNNFVSLLQARLHDLPKAGVALDLGCGPADVTIRVARALPAWQIDGIDGSAAMLRHGRQALTETGLAARINLLQAYLPDASPPRAPYDFVFSNSLLHHLRDPRTLWQCLRLWTASRAAIFVMDLMRPASETEARRLVDSYAGDEPAVLQRDFFHSLLAAYRVDEVTEQLVGADLAHLNVEPVSDRHLIVWGSLVPST